MQPSVTAVVLDIRTPTSLPRGSASFISCLPSAAKVVYLALPRVAMYWDDDALSAQPQLQVDGYMDWCRQFVRYPKRRLIFDLGHPLNLNQMLPIIREVTKLLRDRVKFVLWINVDRVTWHHAAPFWEDKYTSGALTPESVRSDVEALIRGLWFPWPVTPDFSREDWLTVFVETGDGGWRDAVQRFRVREGLSPLRLPMDD